MTKTKSSLYVADYSMSELEKNLCENFFKVGIYFDGVPDYDFRDFGENPRPHSELTKIAREVIKYHSRLYRETLNTIFSAYAAGFLAEHIKKPYASSKFIAELRSAFFADRTGPERKQREYEESWEKIMLEKELAENTNNKLKKV